ncbi:glycosyltransferase family 4 protein [Archaeoglobus neptunius]|uniref:glycosyltransferase family 4 protein n=1 Tax=Archaeoglobus neptunius TaxID=2798580 RepID=UPI0019264907|nr:glycosyltransferase family 4 protein [Archaeoglobus neptunius]
MYTIYITAPNVLDPYLGPSVVAHNTLKGFLTIKNELERENIALTFISIPSCDRRGVVQLDECIKVINMKLYPPVTFTGELQAFLKMHRLNNPNLVHSHDIYSIFPWINKTKTVFTLHGILWKERMYKGPYMRTSLWLNERRFRSFYNLLTRFTAISPYVLKELSQKGFDLSKTVIIENPISDEFFNVEKSEDSVILYPATITARKNQLGFLRSVAVAKPELSDFEIWIVGGIGDKSYFETLTEFVRKEDLRNVKFLGKVPYEKLLELYSKSSIVALTSFQETTPMVIAEAMATETPVIASRAGGMPYMVKHCKTGHIVSPSNPEEIAESLLILASDVRLRKRMGKLAKKEALRRWRAEVICKKLIRLYVSTIQGTDSQLEVC